MNAPGDRTIPSQTFEHFPHQHPNKTMNKTDLRIVYMGTPDFAVAPLRKLVEGGYNAVSYTHLTLPTNQ